MQDWVLYLKGHSSSWLSVRQAVESGRFSYFTSLFLLSCPHPPTLLSRWSSPFTRVTSYEWLHVPWASHSSNFVPVSLYSRRAGLLRFVHAYWEPWSQGTLRPPFTGYALDQTNKMISGRSLDWFERCVGPILPHPSPDVWSSLACGRLGSSIEGGGKKRIFAIGNYVNQRLLRTLARSCSSTVTNRRHLL